MRYSKYTQIRVVPEKDPKQFESAFNQAQVELQSKRPETVKIEITPDGYVAIIQYEVEVEIVETAEDELRQQGLRFTCSDCPKFEPRLNNDGSVMKSAKRGKCFLSDWTRCDSSACEWFCKQFLRGEIKPIGGAK